VEPPVSKKVEEPKIKQNNLKADKSKSNQAKVDPK
jgi:hypothetical protein